MIEIRLERVGQLTARLVKAGAALRTTIPVVLKAAALEIEGEAKKRILRGKKTGIKYGWRPARHGEKPDQFIRIHGHVFPVKLLKKARQASAPGEAPANQTGHLAGSIAAAMENDTTAEVRVPVSYARYLEKGTKHVQMRPFLAVSLQAKKDRIRQMINDEVRRLMT